MFIGENKCQDSEFNRKPSTNEVLAHEDLIVGVQKSDLPKHRAGVTFLGVFPVMTMLGHHTQKLSTCLRQ